MQINLQKDAQQQVGELKFTLTKFDAADAEILLNGKKHLVAFGAYIRHKGHKLYVRPNGQTSVFVTVPDELCGVPVLA